MANEENARQTRGRPFEVGNPGGPGRPPGLSITTLIRRELARANQKEAAKLAKALIKQAASGNATAIKQILDRIDGPVPEQIDVVTLTDSERAERVAALLERARARRAGQPADDE